MKLTKKEKQYYEKFCLEFINELQQDPYIRKKYFWRDDFTFLFLPSKLPKSVIRKKYGEYMGCCQTRYITVSYDCFDSSEEIFKLENIKISLEQIIDYNIKSTIIHELFHLHQYMPLHQSVSQIETATIRETNKFILKYKNRWFKNISESFIHFDYKHELELYNTVIHPYQKISIPRIVASWITRNNQQEKELLDQMYLASQILIKNNNHPIKTIIYIKNNNKWNCLNHDIWDYIFNTKFLSPTTRETISAKYSLFQYLDDNNTYELEITIYNNDIFIPVKFKEKYYIEQYYLE